MCNGALFTVEKISPWAGLILEGILLSREAYRNSQKLFQFLNPSNRNCGLRSFGKSKCHILTILSKDKFSDKPCLDMNSSQDPYGKIGNIGFLKKNWVCAY